MKVCFESLFSINATNHMKRACPNFPFKINWPSSPTSARLTFPHGFISDKKTIHAISFKQNIKIDQIFFRFVNLEIGNQYDETKSFFKSIFYHTKIFFIEFNTNVLENVHNQTIYNLCYIYIKKSHSFHN